MPAECICIKLHHNKYIKCLGTHRGIAALFCEHKHIHGDRAILPQCVGDALMYRGGRLSSVMNHAVLRIRAL